MYLCLNTSLALHCRSQRRDVGEKISAVSVERAASRIAIHQTSTSVAVKDIAVMATSAIYRTDKQQVHNCQPTSWSLENSPLC